MTQGQAESFTIAACSDAVSRIFGLALRFAAPIACLILGGGLSFAQVHLLTDAEQGDIQQAIYRLVRSINDRNLEGVLASVIPRFDAMMPGEYVNLDRLRNLIQNNPVELRQTELASFVRAVRP